jgi:hypothetical protein
MYGDLIDEGPAPADLSPESLADTCARFIAAAGYATLEDSHQYFKACDDALAATASTRKSSFGSTIGCPTS